MVDVPKDMDNDVSSDEEDSVSGDASLKGVSNDRKTPPNISS